MAVSYRPVVKVAVSTLGELEQLRAEMAKAFDLIERQIAEGSGKFNGEEIYVRIERQGKP